jgi:BASS family bile acid:Na+ symporter
LDLGPSGDAAPSRVETFRPAAKGGCLLKDLIVEALGIIAPLSVALIVFAEALSIAPSRVAAFVKDRPLVMLRSLVATLILAPAAALGLILLLKPAPGVAVGLAILVACPPAPLMLKSATKTGGGDPAFMASLHLCLAALAVVTVPAILRVLAIPLEFNADVAPLPLLKILANTILLPIGLGLVVRALFPAWADAFGPRLDKVGGIGLLLVVVAIAAALYPALLNMDARSYGVIAAVCVAGLAIGHLLGPANGAEKTALAVECAVRHPGLAVTIAATNFTPERALPVLVPCVLTFIAIATAYLIWRGRSA